MKPIIFIVKQYKFLVKHVFFPTKKPKNDDLFKKYDDF